MPLSARHDPNGEAGCCNQSSDFAGITRENSVSGGSYRDDRGGNRVACISAT
jgi:hypothetical protein